MDCTDIVSAWELRGQPLGVEGANSRIWREGSSEAVICLHGVPASGFLYRKVLPALATHGLEVITFDLPGMARADRSAGFHRPWVMEPIAHPVIGPIWVGTTRTPLIIPLMRAIGVHDGPGNADLRAYGDLLTRVDGGAAFRKVMRGFERTPESDRHGPEGEEVPGAETDRRRRLESRQEYPLPASGTFVEHTST